MDDIIIKNGYIVDGSGNPWFKKDIGIKDKIIEKIGNLNSVKAKLVINARGLIVSPGFIDVHSHSDLWLLMKDNLAKSKVMQGVTTEIVGNCGYSVAPVEEENKDLLKEYITPLMGIENIEIEWTTIKDYLLSLKNRGIGINVASLVGQGTIRIAVMGFDNRKPNGKELEKMRMLAAQAMRDGALGISTGLIYPPGSYADIRELISICQIISQYGGIYASHIRSEGETLVEAVKEAIKIGEEANLPVEISHHKANNKSSWGKVKETLKIMDEARKRGIDVTCDQYPYTEGCGLLTQVLPPWIQEGGVKKLITRLKNQEIRKRLKKEFKEDIPGWDNYVKVMGWDKIMITSVSSLKNKYCEGKTVKEISQEQKKDPLDFVFDLLIEEECKVMMINFIMCEEDVCTVMKYPGTMIGTDGVHIEKGRAHPRLYGTFPRILGKYVREEKILRLEEAVRKMTSLPAQRLGLKYRGLIKEGMCADITIFDPDRIIDKATYMHSEYPEGIKYVIINGKLVVEEGIHNRILAGRVLSHNG